MNCITAALTFGADRYLTRVTAIYGNKDFGWL